MPLPKDVALKMGLAHRLNPEDLGDLTEMSVWLEGMLHEACSIWEENGELIFLHNKHLVERLKGLKIEVYSNEHPPPHFHVKSPNVNASFDIKDCAILNGKISKADHLKVRYWHQFSKSRLIDAWNSTRPFNCVVGEYVDT
jgi:hypothetical protein